MKQGKLIYLKLKNKIHSKNYYIPFHIFLDMKFYFFYFPGVNNDVDSINMICYEGEQ